MFNNVFGPSITEMKMELAPSSPRLRLSLISYLLEHGVPAGYDIMELLKELLAFVTEAYEAFVKELDAADKAAQEGMRDMAVKAPEKSEPVDDVFNSAAYL